MFRFGVILLGLLVVSLASSLRSGPKQLKQAKRIGPRIVNGEEALLGELPWQAALYLTIDENIYFCGGIIIEAEWILTSGSCLIDVQNVTVETGIIDIDSSEGAQVLDSVELILHEDFDPDTLEHSIALIKLEAPLHFNENTSKIDLTSARIGGLVEVVTSGWGSLTNDSDDLSQTLRYAYLMTITTEECQDFYGKDVIHDGNLCAISMGPVISGPCAGDTGGPLVVAVHSSPILVGIMDFISEAGCGSGHPVGFTRISSYVDWIRSKIN